MLKLSGLTLDAKLSGTVTICAGEIIGPRYVGATSRQKLYITTSDDDNLLVVEDQRFKGETLGYAAMTDAEMDRADAETEARNG